MMKRAAVFALVIAFNLMPAQSHARARRQESRIAKHATDSCAAMRDLSWPEVRITEAVPVAASGNPSDVVKVAHCRVSGVVGKEIGFSVLLPDDWNQRFFMGGGGGLSGSVQNAAASSINVGYATAGTDTGHQTTDRDDGSWALNDLERQLNFGYLAVHRTAEVAKAIVHAYYGSAPIYSYFLGCSLGGRQALMEAQRYPQDFDGIVAGAPGGINLTKSLAGGVKGLQALFPDAAFIANPVVTAANRTLLQSKILEACDARDGVEDGVMEDPRDCPFTLGSIAPCPDDRPGPDCLTSAQRAAFMSMWGGSPPA